MIFDTELEAFETYAHALPHNCVFLVDTYNTLKGVDNAIEVGRGLRANGYELLGVRIDSGDLSELSIEARKRLDAAGFPSAHIFATNDLDERIIQSLKEQGARIAVWGVGTRLVTAHEDPALGGVYKLSAIRRPGADWQYRIKLSEQPQKVSTPGILQVRRFEREGALVADAIFDEERGPPAVAGGELVDFFDSSRRTLVPHGASFTDLLVPVLRGGKLVRELPSLNAIRDHTLSSIARLPSGVKRFLNPHLYPVGLEPSLFELKTNMVIRARNAAR
jgi:nicotinate phosphoribosyltransferase